MPPVVNREGVSIAGKRSRGPGCVGLFENLIRLSFPPPPLPHELAYQSPSAMQEYHDLLRSTSRTFAVGIEALPNPLRDAVTLAYLILRVSDYFEDSPTLTADRKHRSLEEWAALLKARPTIPDHEVRTALAALSATISAEDRELPDHQAAQAAAHIFEGLLRLPHPMQEVIRTHTAATTSGMARWTLRGDNFPDEAALDEYMFEVAGRVGILLTDLFLEQDPRLQSHEDALRGHAVAFGLGLQTVNIVRGLHEDPARGWNFVPRDLLPAGEGLIDLRSLPEVDRLRILDFLVRKSGRHIADAFLYCQALPAMARGIRIFCIVPALIAGRTAEASRGNLDVFRRPVKVDRSEVARLVARTRLLSFSNRWLEQERRRALVLAGAST